MKSDRTAYKLLWMLVCALLCMTIFLTVRVTAAAEASPASIAAAPQLHYQGRLLDPDTGAALPDGSYIMTLGIYNAAAEGTLLWTESKSVVVSKGIFSTMLGDTTPFAASLFDGQDLWLGVSVGGDPEMTPRQPLAYVPYAIFANTADQANTAAQADTAANADQLDGYDSSAFAFSDHMHAVLPQAYGYISQYEPHLLPGSYNVDSAAWNSTLSLYEITLTNFYFDYDDIAVVTLRGDAGNCPAGTVARTSNMNGNLLVVLVNNAGDNISNCNFHFVAFAGQQP